MAIVFGDSPADAAFLKNSVRVGDRSKMTIFSKPSPGQRNLIRPPEIETPPAAREESQAWFWQQHRADIDAAGSYRWGTALETLRVHRAGGSALFNPDRMQALANRYEALIASAARRHDISELLILAVIAVESSGDGEAVSPKGAQGLMQLIPATAQRFGVANSLDPVQNVNGGAAYLDWLLKNFREDPILALAGYNAGEGAIDRYSGVPPFSETRDYVVKVFDALAAAQALCKTPLDTPRTACGWPSGASS